MNFQNRIRQLFAYPFYPFLFGIYPVLYLWSSNRAQQPAYVLLPALIITLVSLLVIYLLTLALTRSSHRAALISTLLSFFILTYGQFYALAHKRFPGLQAHDALMGAGLFVLALILVAAVRKWGSLNLTKVFNLVAAGLVIMQLVTAVPYYVRMAQMQNQSSKSFSGQTVAPKNFAAELKNTGAAEAPPTLDGERELAVTGGRPQTNQPQRDVYFILIDNYGRQDILKQGANLDNSALIEALETRGFVFPDCTQGNYSSTAPVIASILNMDYMNKLGIKNKAFSERGHYDDMSPLIQDSQVINKFRNYGYHIVTFRGFMGLIDIKSSDTYINFEKDLSMSRRIETLDFQSLYLGTTALSAVNEEYKIYPDWVMKDGPEWLRKMVPSQELLAPKYEQVYRQNMYAFDALERIPGQLVSPKFVYAHIYTAHWPFITQPDGSLRLPFTEEQTVAGYVDGMRYTNSRVLSVIDSILKNSKTKPVIILQGDHSNEWTRPVEWSGKDRLKILSGYYLPDGGNQLLYDSISPVNNFRLVFSKYFGENINLLPDVWYYLDPKTKTIKSAPKTCMSDAQ